VRACARIRRISFGNDVAEPSPVRQTRRALIAVLFLSAAYLYSGPVTSGAAFLLLPPAGQSAGPGIAEDYTPYHKGGVNLSTGLYVRENEDLVVPGSPALILRRTYLSRYRTSKQFGIGTTHNGEQYVIGDGERFQWASLIQANGARIHFIRTSPGTSFFNAMYRHTSTATEWQGAELGWTWGRWALRRLDGALMIFQACGPGTVCSIIESRDPEGHSIYYKRDKTGRLTRMESGPDRWITLEYDASDRVSLASASGGRSVRYAYDDRGRLATVTSSDGTIRKYTYTDEDELATMTEPGTTIQNIYEKGRVVRQINRFDDEPKDAEPLTFDFTYHLDGDHIVRTDTRRSDGIWSSFTWDDDHQTVSETRGRDGREPTTVTHERDPFTNAVTAITVTCPDRTGRPLSHTSIVRNGNQEWIKDDLMRMHCSARLRDSRMK
jgi:YD repeat-containing protein